MTVYADYSVEEQQLLKASLEAAAIVISAASFGRSEETVSEGFAAAALVLDSRDEYVSNPLVSSVILELEREARSEGQFPDYVAVATADGASGRALDTLRSVVALLDRAAEPDEAAGYKRWLLQIATAVAQAGKEDQGVLGFGGVLVNDSERAALVQVAELLGIDG